ncbi:MAG: OadG family protein [Candidatus Gastranaerophilales bacterium]|nr:OadG family protein [Candidatus Gastranaerophilales bacterium]
MLDSSLWATGLTTMIVGMGIVFSFLVILVFAINIMVKCVEIVNKLCPLPVETPKAVKKAGTNDAEIALAIAIAKAQ